MIQQKAASPVVNTRQSSESAWWC